MSAATLLENAFILQPGVLFELLHFMRSNVEVVFGVLLLAGWAVISYFYIARPVRDMEMLMESTEALAHPGDTPIRLPKTMQNAENRLNLVREQALHNIRAARDAEQRKNDLVVYLAHDLKTPLTSVIGYLTLLQDEPQLSPAMRARYTGVALEKALRLEDLINEFFDITRFSLTHLELELQSVDLKRMLEQIASEFEPTLRQKEIRCELDLSQAAKKDRYLQNVIGSFQDGMYSGEMYLTTLNWDGNQEEWNGMAEGGVWSPYGAATNKKEVPVCQDVDDDANYLWILVRNNKDRGIDELMP